MQRRIVGSFAAVRIQMLMRPSSIFWPK